MRRRPVHIRPAVDGPYNARPKRTWVDSIVVLILVILVAVIGGLHLWGML